MLGWGIVIFIGLVFIFWDFPPVAKAWLMGHPMLIHIVVIGSGLLLHGGSAQGAMAAIASGLFSALFVRYQRKFNGYISGGKWHPGKFNWEDPRIAAKRSTPPGTPA